jgi:hypothetical protein
MVRTKASERPYFPLLGEPLALDFLNTELWREGSTVDLIGDPHRWKQWLGYQQRRLEPILGGPVTAQMRSAGPPRRVRELRDAARVVANAVDHAHPAGQPATAISLQAAVRVHEDGTLQVRITVEDGGRWKPPTADSGFRGRGVLLMPALSESVQFQTTGAGTCVVVDSHRISAPPAAALPEPRSAIVPPVPPVPPEPQ